MGFEEELTAIKKRREFESKQSLRQEKKNAFVAGSVSKRTPKLDDKVKHSTIDAMASMKVNRQLKDFDDSTADNNTGQ